jgi:hypothetical protein
VSKSWVDRASWAAEDLWKRAEGSETPGSRRRSCVGGDPQGDDSCPRGVDLAGATSIDDHRLEHIMIRKLRQAPQGISGKVTVDFLEKEWDRFGIDDLDYLDFVSVAQYPEPGRTTFLAPANGGVLAVRKADARHVCAAA